MGTIADIPHIRQLPYDVYFRFAEFLADTYTEPHSHPFGQLNFVSRGTMEMEVASVRYLSPPQYAVWIPPGWKHDARNAAVAAYRSAYISAPRSKLLPSRPCTLTISPILRAILMDFAARSIHVPATASDRRLAQVLLDQLETTQRYDSFLPCAQSAELQAILNALQANLASNQPLTFWATSRNMTMRTLERRCQQELGISFGEWRQRLRFLRAIEWLDEGRSVQRIAFDLGYTSPSAFFAMFRRHAGTTPEQYRLMT